jgi:hypothetical protein
VLDVEGRATTKAATRNIIAILTAAIDILFISILITSFDFGLFYADIFINFSVLILFFESVSKIIFG